MYVLWRISQQVLYSYNYVKTNSVWNKEKLAIYAWRTYLECAQHEFSVKNIDFNDFYYYNKSEIIGKFAYQFEILYNRTFILYFKQIALKNKDFPTSFVIMTLEKLATLPKPKSLYRNLADNVVKEYKKRAYENMKLLWRYPQLCYYYTLFRENSVVNILGK